jgi:hypothetical protein
MKAPNCPRTAMNPKPLDCSPAISNVEELTFAF